MVCSLAERAAGTYSVIPTPLLNGSSGIKTTVIGTNGMSATSRSRTHDGKREGPMFSNQRRSQIVHHPRTFVDVVVACVLAAVLLNACGTLDQPTEQPTTGASMVPGTTSNVCAASQLTLDQKDLGAGGGQYQDAWSLTNSSATPCTLNGGLPTLELDNTTGKAAATYHTAPHGAVSTAALTLQPGYKVWFFTNTQDVCPERYQTLTGGPFREVVVLPGTQTKIPWIHNGLGLNRLTLPNMCPTFNVTSSGLQTTEPTLQNVFGLPGTPVATGTPVVTP